MLPLIVIVLILTLSAFVQAKFTDSTFVNHPKAKHAANVDSHKA